MFKIKICGITTPDDALLAADAGADAIGFNFYEKSPRCVSSDRAKEIAAQLPVYLRTAGVFVNMPIEEIVGLQRHVGLDIIQLHGNEPPEMIYQLRAAPMLKVNRPRNGGFSCDEIEVIRAIRCQGAGLNEAIQFLEECRRVNPQPKDERGPDGLLLDAYDPSVFGGTGKSINWEAISRDHVLVWTRLILAGGLTPDNVAKAISTAQPDAVDVASGVESSPGKKDPTKVRDFVAAAKEAFAKLARSTSKG